MNNHASNDVHDFGVSFNIIENKNYRKNDEEFRDISI